MELTKRSSTRKRLRTSNIEQNMPTVDRLSGLPDSLLCHILSFLPTKFSIATSILAKRWRFVWVGVSNFDLSSDDHSTYSNDEPRFADVINRILQHNVQPVNTFRLTSTNTDEEFTEYQIETWIGTAIARKVQRLELYLDSLVKLPRCLFTCKTLVDLRLQGCELRASLPACLCFPSLKELRLCSVQYNADETLPHLISGCPVLEKLVINTILERDMFCCSISSPTITCLMVKFELDGLLCNSHDYRMEINAPAIRYLRMEDCLSEHISAQTLASLIEADVCLMDEIDKENEILYSGSVLAFLDRLYNVKCLKLSIDHKKFLHSAFSACSVPTIRFQNLTNLELAADWRFISKFLGVADNLEVLIIRKVDEDLKYWMKPLKVPTCLSSHLRTIKVFAFGYAEHEFEMVRYLLGNAQVLERMGIYTDSDTSDYKEKFRGLQRISQFRRGSAACQLFFN